MAAPAKSRNQRLAMSHRILCLRRTGGQNNE
jgi:hypothetical protein